MTDNSIDQTITQQYRNLAPHIIRQRLIIEATTHQLVGPDRLVDYLTKLAQVTNMEILSGPHAYSAHELGWGSWVHWRTSGATAYSYPAQNAQPALVTVDTYTCKPFSIKAAVEFTRNYFNPIDIVYKEI